MCVFFKSPLGLNYKIGIGNEKCNITSIYFHLPLKCKFYINAIQAIISLWFFSWRLLAQTAIHITTTTTLRGQRVTISHTLANLYFSKTSVCQNLLT